jgi:hypothetical protein
MWSADWFGVVRDKLVRSRRRTSVIEAEQWMTPKVYRELTTQFPPRDPQWMIDLSGFHQQNGG